MIISPSSLDTNLSQLLDEVNSGKTQLPEFQRDWTWDDNRIRGIIASLSQGYHMGAIMRLQYGNPDIKFKYRTIKGVGQRDLAPDFLVLDGQQRLTSIYQATYSKNPVATKTDKGKKIERYYYLSMEKCMDENEDRYDAVLPVPADRKIKENFDRDIKLDLSDQQKEYEHKMFPVNIIFDSNALMKWQFGYMMYYRELHRRAYRRAADGRARRFSGLFGRRGELHQRREARSLGRAGGAFAAVRRRVRAGGESHGGGRAAHHGQQPRPVGDGAGGA